MTGKKMRRYLSSFARKTLQLTQKLRGKKIVHFLHIGKTGGSAIKHVLKNHPATRDYAIYLHPHESKLSDIPQGEGVMFFVRDPIGKFVSGFYSRQRQGRPKYFSPWSEAEKAAFEHFQTPNQLALALSSPDDEERERARRAMRGIRHVADSYWNWFHSEAYLTARKSDIFFVGAQDRLNEDFRSLKRILGLSEAAELPQDDLNAHKTPSNLDKTLVPQAIENLQEWYREEFEFLRICQELMVERG
jgi:hypothetical protein